MDKNLLTAIEAELGNSKPPYASSTYATSDIFEAYIFTLVLQAAKIEGAKVFFVDVFGKPVSDLCFRTSPGYIFSTKQPYTHAVIQFRERPTLEAHVGIRVTGQSGVLHECDISVIYQSEAETCRIHRVSPRSVKVVMAIECKFYSTNVPLGLAREFMGLKADLSAQECFFVINSTSSTVEKLLAMKKRLCETNIVPGATKDVERLRNAFQKTFKDFKARNN